MSGELIALNKPLFWICFFIAVLCLGPLANLQARKWIFAGINLGFLTALLNLQVVWVLGGLLIVFGSLQLSKGLNRLPVAALAASTLCVFLFHKGAFPLEPSAHPLAVLLSTIGFSFIALRLVEVMRAISEERQPPPDFPAVVNYLVPFHMLAAGPIQSYDEFAAQSKSYQARTAADVLGGAERIAAGLFKKFVLAFLLKEVFLTNFQASGFYSWIELQVFFVWLYLDFSAYSDIAVGVGRIIGVATPENFRNPLLARNLIDFWERWHISLSQFIQRNLYVPIQLALARSSDSARPLVFGTVALFISFELCGMWHGLSWAWLAWGALHGFGLAAVRVYTRRLQSILNPNALKSYRANPVVRVISTVITFEYVAFSFFPLYVSF